MGEYSALISSIVNNTAAHVVNRDDKMSLTLDVMCSNINKKIRRSSRMIGRHNAAEVRGYGLNKNTGD